MNDKKDSTLVLDKEYPKPPKGIKVLINGAGYDTKRKRIAYKPGTFGDNPNAVDASQLSTIRWNNTRQAINEAIISQAYASGLNVQSGSEAIAIGASALYKDILDGNGTLRDRNTTLWDIARYAGLIDSKNERMNSSANVQVNIGLDALRTILDKTGGQVLDL